MNVSNMQVLIWGTIYHLQQKRHRHFYEVICATVDHYQTKAVPSCWMNVCLALGIEPATYKSVDLWSNK